MKRTALPRRTRAIAWGLGIASGFAALMTGTAVSQEPPPDKMAVTQDPAEDPRLVQQIPLVEAADSLASVAEEEELVRFQGVTIDHANGALLLSWFGGPIANDPLNFEIQEIRTAEEIPVIISRAEYRVSDLDAEAIRIMDLDPSRINGVRVTAAGPTDSYDGLIISVEPADLPLARDSIKSPFNLTFEAMPMVEPIRRWNDVPPFWAGAGADRYVGGDNPYEYCTPNFSVTAVVSPTQACARRSPAL